MGVKEDLPASGDDVSPSKERCKKEAVATKPRQKQGRTPRESKIMAPSPRRGNHHDGRLTPPSKEAMGMYERSKVFLAAKEQKLEQAKHKLMEDCTFTPETNKSRSSHGSTPMFDRLHSESRKVTPKKASIRGREICKWSPTSMGSSCGSTPSRIDKLYRDGVRKAKNRQPTDKREAEARRRRLEDQELEQCTFRPKMDWRTKNPPRGRKGTSSPNGSKDASSKESLCTPRSHDAPPVDVITTRAVLTPTMNETSHSVVSPLRVPDIPVALNGAESIGDDTEYGSI